MTISVGILAVSDRCYRGESDDASGPLIGRLVLERLAAEVEQEEVVPDEQEAIRGTLVR
jgi:molybdopterin biosynthesis enzyme MoaB